MPKQVSICTPRMYLEDEIDKLLARIAEAVRVLKRPNCGCHGCDQDRTDALSALEGKP